MAGKPFTPVYHQMVIDTEVTSPTDVNFDRPDWADAGEMPNVPEKGLAAIYIDMLQFVDVAKKLNRRRFESCMEYLNVRNPALMESTWSVLEQQFGEPVFAVIDGDHRKVQHAFVVSQHLCGMGM